MWYPPPERPPNEPVVSVIPAGTTLYRVHSASFGPVDFNPTDPDAPEAGGGGRFDSLAGKPPFLYAARSAGTSIAEALLRDVPFDDRGMRELPRVALERRCLSEVLVVEDLEVVAAHGEGLSRLGQDTWLTRCDAAEYAQCRAWGAAIMGWFPQAAGLEWRPRHDDDGLAVCLYETRAGHALEAGRTLELWRGEGLALARAALLRFGVAPPSFG